MTTLHVKWNPLGSGDWNFYVGWKNRLYKLGDERVTKHRQGQAWYRERRRQRLIVQMRGASLGAETQPP